MSAGIHIESLRETPVMTKYQITTLLMLLLLVCTDFASAEVVNLLCPVKVEYTDFCDPYIKGFNAECLSGIQDPDFQESFVYRVVIDLDNKIVQARIEYPEEGGDLGWSVLDNVVFGPKTISYKRKDEMPLNVEINSFFKTTTEWEISRETLVHTYKIEMSGGYFPDPDTCRQLDMPLDFELSDMDAFMNQPTESTCWNYRSWSKKFFDSFSNKRRIYTTYKFRSKCALVENNRVF